jgi:hypothetical protein
LQISPSAPYSRTPPAYAKLACSGPNDNKHFLISVGSWFGFFMHAVSICHVFAPNTGIFHHPKDLLPVLSRVVVLPCIVLLTGFRSADSWAGSQLFKWILSKWDAEP